MSEPTAPRFESGDLCTIRHSCVSCRSCQVVEVKRVYARGPDSPRYQVCCVLCGYAPASAVLASALSPLSPGDCRETAEQIDTRIVQLGALRKRLHQMAER